MDYLEDRLVDGNRIRLYNGSICLEKLVWFVKESLRFIPIEKELPDFVREVVMLQIFLRNYGVSLRMA